MTARCIWPYLVTITCFNCNSDQMKGTPFPHNINKLYIVFFYCSRRDHFIDRLLEDTFSYFPFYFGWNCFFNKKEKHVFICPSFPTGPHHYNTCTCPHIKSSLDRWFPCTWHRNQHFLYNQPFKKIRFLLNPKTII